MTEVAPYQRFASATGGIDWFMLPFDKRGRCIGPQTRAHLVGRAADPAITDVFVFSHGWNNDWNDSTKRYRDFIEGYFAHREVAGLPLGRPLRPLLIGVYWPSTALVFGSERGMKIAADGGPDTRRARDVEEFGAEIGTLAEEVDEHDVERLYALAEKDALSTAEGEELARILAPALGTANDEVPDEPASGGATAIVEAWRELPSFDGTAGADAEDPAAIAARLDDWGLEETSGELEGAGLGKLDPRQIVRLTTVRVMKDRAGVVGSFGLGSFVAELLASSEASRPRVHLVGHSYGAKVSLSAICHPRELSRPVDSLLLLQPAVSHRCFARDELGTGGYVDAPEARVDLPILSTFSKHDIPLRRFFHFAARRAVDRDELRTAAGELSRYAALGGYGPHGVAGGSPHLEALQPGPNHAYDLGDSAHVVYGIDASATIDGHGDIDNASTHWALDNLVAAPRRRAET
jgi:hypothetical protein